MGELQCAEASSFPLCNQPLLSLRVWDPSTPMVLSHLPQEPSPSGQYMGTLPILCCSPGKKGANHVLS